MWTKILPSFVIILHVIICEINNIIILKDMVHVMLEDKLFPPRFICDFDCQVSDFIGTFQQQEEEKYQLQILKYIPELNEVIGKLL